MTARSERHLHTRIRILESKLEQSRAEIRHLNRQLADALKGIAPPEEPRREPMGLLDLLCGPGTAERAVREAARLEAVESDLIPSGKVVLVSDRQIAFADLDGGQVGVVDRPALFPDEYILDFLWKQTPKDANLASGTDETVEQKWPPEPDDDEAWRIADYHWHPFMGDYEKAVYVVRDKDGHLHWAWPNAGFMTTLDKHHLRLRLGPGECECRRSNVRPGKDEEPAEAEEAP